MVCEFTNFAVNYGKQARFDDFRLEVVIFDFLNNECKQIIKIKVAFIIRMIDIFLRNLRIQILQKQS